MRVRAGERYVGLIALCLPLDDALQHAEVAAGLDRELAEEGAQREVARAGELAQQVELCRGGGHR